MSDEIVCGLNKSQFRKLLELATKDSFILFNKKYYSQIDGVAMGSPLGPTLANIFLCHHERKWLLDCPSDFRPLCFLRYVDDIFVLFKSADHVDGFHQFINSRHPRMNFTVEVEQENCLPFLDVNVTRLGSNFVTSVFRKPTFSGVYTHYDSFIPEVYKHNLLSTLLFRSHTICSDWKAIHGEISFLKVTLEKNAYPGHIVERMVRKFLNKVCTSSPPTKTVTDRERFDICLPFLGLASVRVKKNITKLFRNFLPHCDINFVFKSSSRLSSHFSFKDKLPGYLVAGVIYKYTCSRCKSTYVGKTKRHIRKRFSEHQGRSPLTGKLVKGQCSTTVRDHMLHCDTVVEFSDFLLLGHESNNLLLKMKESIFIRKERPSLNIQGQSFPLKLFR